MVGGICQLVLVCLASLMAINVIRRSNRIRKIGERSRELMEGLAKDSAVYGAGAID